MMSIKKGVKLAGLKPEMGLGALVVYSAYRDLGHDCIITSGLDGMHSPTSLHYKGLALDFRTRHLPTESKRDLAVKVAAALGEEFDVVLEPTHLHVEWDPNYA